MLLIDSLTVAASLRLACQRFQKFPLNIQQTCPGVRNRGSELEQLLYN
jgi:hypothetical protein